MSRMRALHKKWMKSCEYRRALEDLAPEFALARTLIEARVCAGNAQEQAATGCPRPTIRSPQ